MGFSSKIKFKNYYKLISYWQQNSYFVILLYYVKRIKSKSLAHLQRITFMCICDIKLETSFFFSIHLFSAFNYID
jgi:hypothetical protein